MAEKVPLSLTFLISAKLPTSYPFVLSDDICKTVTSEVKSDLGKVQKTRLPVSIILTLSGLSEYLNL